MEPAPEATPARQASLAQLLPCRRPERRDTCTCAAGASVRVQDGSTGANQVHYLYADHLGSSNASYRSDGSQTVTQR